MGSPSTSIPPLTAEEEDHIILARITNDERPLKRVIKRFHNYLGTISTKNVAPSESTQSAASVEDAKETFFVELASFQLLLKKSVMICEAENRQVEEYQKERQRIEREHEALRTQIRELKVALEYAQLLRRRKMEYDVVAEKIHTLPSREELEQEISALENDITAIHSENDTQDRTIQTHKSALDGIIAELSSLRFLGRDKDTTSEAPSTRVSPDPDGMAEPPIEAHVEGSTRANSVIPDPAGQEERDEKLSMESDSQNVPGTPLDNDIEMGELEEDPKDKEAAKKKPMDDELEEGETFDGSSELSEPPDDSDDDL